MTIKLTVSIEESVLRSARRYAAQRETSVNALVRDYLARFVEQSERLTGVRRRLRELSESSEARIGRVEWSREG